MSVALVWVIHPFLQELLLKIPRTCLLFFALAIFVVFVIDIMVTVHTILKLNGKLEAIYRALEELSEKTEAYKKQLELNIEEKIGQRQQLREEKEEIRKEQKEIWMGTAKEKIAELKTWVSELQMPDKKLQNRIIQAFPQISSKRHPDILEDLKKAIAERKDRGFHQK